MQSGDPSFVSRSVEGPRTRHDVVLCGSVGNPGI